MLWSEGLLLVWTGSWPLPVGVMPYSTVNTPSEVFVVLDAPKAPMSPAWVSVLRLSCSWASGATDDSTAARKVTNALHLWGDYNGGVPAFTNSVTDASENFYLRRCVESFVTSGVVGQCSDFADLLLCLQTSLGLNRRAVQRTHPLDSAARESQLPNGNTGLLLGFQTHVIDAARYGASQYDGSPTWSYHQFCTDSRDQVVWDACLQFRLSHRVAVNAMPREPDYRDHLVKTYYFLDQLNGLIVSMDDPASFWRPTPTGGFIPNATAN